jgi:hypothetical protein
VNKYRITYTYQRVVEADSSHQALGMVLKEPPRHDWEPTGVSVRQAQPEEELVRFTGALLRLCETWEEDVDRSAHAEELRTVVRKAQRRA